MVNHRMRILYGLVLFCISAFCEECDQRHTAPELVGHRCVTETEIYFTIHGIDRYHCTLKCMRRSSCGILNYNFNKNQCFIGNGTCVSLQPNKEYQVNVLSPRKRDGCLKWVSSAELIHPVATNACQMIPCYVGRLVSPPNILPGRYRVTGQGEEIISTVLDGLNYNEDVMEILDVESDCQVAWMSFTSGDAIPPHAIVGGYIESSGSALYIIGGNVTQGGVLYTSYGYYDPVTTLGYTAKGPVYTFVKMEMLVLLWSIPIILRLFMHIHWHPSVTHRRTTWNVWYHLGHRVWTNFLVQSVS